MTEDGKPASATWKVVSLLLALLPPARMARIVFKYGEDNLSNDYIARVPLVASMLDGSCSLGRFVREAWTPGGGHSMLAVIPIYYLNARLFAWSVWVELGLGLALVAATLVLLMCAIPGRARWFTLPLFSLLLFSTSRVTVFTFGEPALQYGLSQLGIAIGVCALAWWREKPTALATALALGGLLASWSWGGGVMAWPAFAVALVALRVRSPGAWAIFLSGSALGVAQYVWLLLLQPADSSAMRLSPSLDVRAILDLLGRPFINGIATEYGPSFTSQILGLAGLAMLAFLLVRGRGRPRRAPALVLAGWSLLVAAQIATFRSGIAPWYVDPMAFFWAGLVLLLANTGAPMRAIGIATICILALRVQGTWEDKSFYLPSRSPASAACLREWRTAPVGCEVRLYQWSGGGGPAGLGVPLEHHHLSVFGPRRTYLLQGDATLGLVRLDPASAPSFFSLDGITPGRIEDFRRLDLVLSPGATVSWRVDVPPGTAHATFSTVIRAASGDPQLERAARVSVSAGGKSVFLDERAFIPRKTARPLVVDLSPLAGRQVTLRLAGDETQAGATPLIFEAPKIEVALENTK